MSKARNTAKNTEATVMIVRFLLRQRFRQAILKYSFITSMLEVDYF
jgi:hypothetical protein